MINNINNFIKIFRSTVDTVGSTFVKRVNKNNNNKLNFKNTLYCSSIALKKKGISSVSSDVEIDKILIVSKNAIIKVRNNEKTFKHIRDLNNELIKKIYDYDNKFIKPYNFILSNNNSQFIQSNTKINKKLFINRTQKRFVAVDGSQYAVDKMLINNDDIKASKDKDYGCVLFTNLYDVMNNIPINYSITASNDVNFDKKKVSETTGLINQLDHLNSNDVLIMDKWYWSIDLHKILISKQIGYIFRMKNNSTYFKNLKYNTSNIIKINNVDVQLFKYKIKKNNYYMLSSIIEKISINEIKAIYWKRWKIESDNKKFKYNILSTNIRSKNYNSLLVDVETIRFISLISSIIEYAGKDDLKFKKKYNTENCLDILYKTLLNLLFYSNDKNEIFRILGIVYKATIDIVYGRSYLRKRVKPSTKWNKYGNRFGDTKAG